MLKAFEDRQLSKSMYLSDKRMIITASRGRAVKVSHMPLSSGRYPNHGETVWQTRRRNERSRSDEKWRISTKLGRRLSVRRRTLQTTT